MENSKKIKWFSKPELQDYPAATSYLTLLFKEKEVSVIITKLKKAKLIEFKAKDVFRTSGLSLLGVSNLHVRKNLKKIKAGKQMSPILLVRNPMLGKVIIADGYHRMCAIYRLNEDAVLKCKIVDL